MITRRRVLLAVLALILAGVGTIAWTLAGLPPIKYHLRYGLDPYCEPTGEKVTLEGVEFVEIGPGISRMGSSHLAEGDWLGRISALMGLPWGEDPRPSNEMPVHWVEFRRGFWIATTEITNAQFERFKPEHVRSGCSTGDSTPVVGVTWRDARDYCHWLYLRSGWPIRLPSEAEWECACRAGSLAKFTSGGDQEGLAELSWYGRGWEKVVQLVATKKPNRWGLFDLHGNAEEWCQDTWHDSYVGAPVDGRPWQDSRTERRIVRGGCVNQWYMSVRSAARWACYEAEPTELVGFRPAFCNPPD